MRQLSPLTIPFRAFELLFSLGVAALVLVFTARAVVQGTAWLVLIAVGVLAAVGVSLGYAVAYYRRFEYALTSDTFDVSWGVFSRRDREIPYRRIQNVSISRNIVQRLVGIAEVRVETAGGDQSAEVHLRYVSDAEARRLQEAITDRKREAGPETADDLPEEEEAGEELFAITSRELALLGVVSFDLRLVGLVLVAATFLDPSTLSEVFVAIPAVALAPVAIVAIYLVGAIVGGIVAVTNYYDFRLHRLRDELRYQRGLLQQFSGSIPFEKIQSMSIEENVLARRVGYASLHIETAGYSPNETSGSQTAIPLAKADRVTRLAGSIEAFDPPTFSRPPKRARRRYVGRYSLAILGLTVVAVGLEVVDVLPFAWYYPLALLVLTPVAAHLKWRNLGYDLQEDHVITRAGFWNRRTFVVPYHRMQTVFQRQTIFQRRWNLASVRIDTAGSRALVGQDAVAYDLDVATAAALREHVNDRLHEQLQVDRSGFDWITAGTVTPA